MMELDDITHNANRDVREFFSELIFAAFSVHHPPTATARISEHVWLWLYIDIDAPDLNNIADEVS